MKKNTKKLLVAGGLAAGAAVVLGAIVFWPKTAAAGTNATLPAQLDANLSDAQKKDVANLVYNSNDPAVLAQAAWNYEKAYNAPLAAQYLADKSLSLIKSQLDANIPPHADDILYPLYISTDPVELQSIGLKLQNDGYPKAAALVMARARTLSGL